jgi:N-glycosylase/DNA lyase
VWQIAQRDYKFGKGKHKSLTKATYDAVGDHFRSLWGKEAGWAHSVLFTADLRAFSERLTTKVEVKEEEVVKIEANGEVEVEAVQTSVISRKRGAGIGEEKEAVERILSSKRVKRERKGRA